MTIKKLRNTCSIAIAIVILSGCLGQPSDEKIYDACLEMSYLKAGEDHRKFEILKELGVPSPKISSTVRSIRPSFDRGVFIAECKTYIKTTFY